MTVFVYNRAVFRYNEIGFIQMNLISFKRNKCVGSILNEKQYTTQCSIPEKPASNIFVSLKAT